MKIKLIYKLLQTFTKKAEVQRQQEKLHNFVKVLQKNILEGAPI